MGIVGHDGRAAVAVDVGFGGSDYFAFCIAVLDVESVKDGAVLLRVEFGGGRRKGRVKRGVGNALVGCGGMASADELSIFVEEVVGEGHHVVAVHVLSVAGIGSGEECAVGYNVAIVFLELF